MKRISSSEYKKMPWKNGLGTTHEIAIFPSTASVTEANFDWRLSSALIEAANAFSTYPGFDRLLVVCSGGSLEINGVMHKSLIPFAFPGEEKSFCQPHFDPGQTSITDLGLIYRRDKYRASMTIKSFPERGGIWEPPEGLNFLYGAAGGLTLGELTLKPGDTLRLPSLVSNPLKIQAWAEPATVVIHIHLKDMR